MQHGYFAFNDTNNGSVSPYALPVSSPLESSAIHVLARVVRAGGAFSVSGSIDLRDLQLEQRGDVRKGAMEIRMVQQNAAGNVLESKRRTMELQLTGAEYEAYVKSGIFFQGMIELKEGLTTLRVIVTDSINLTVGSLVVPVSEIK